ncbi:MULTISPECIES: hypothetical protein [Streptomyces]|uniref:hypothetical protein n=1 Tax=Streptomyces TaxID=1883 RepID=UPI00055C0A0B|nr:hypothetical protein [Streptomyces sp. PAN_FS17]SEC12783.1 hypothetical protein SAMN05216482_2205 [Streptomyces sp. PAN_FS17]
MGMATVGLFTGMALGFAGHLAGFGASLLVAALGAIGFVSGRFADGDGELGDFFTAASTATGGGETSRPPEDDRRRN